MGLKSRGPVEDEATRQRREAAERRAEISRIETTQEILDDETRRRIRRFGSRASLGGGGRASSLSAQLGGIPAAPGQFRQLNAFL